MQFLPAIICLLIGAAGWFYAFCSRAAVNLSGIESDTRNRRRVRLRRIGGTLMVLLAVALYVGIEGIDAQSRPAVFALVWLGVLLLMTCVGVLGWLDLRLTQRLRRERQGKIKP